LYLYTAAAKSAAIARSLLTEAKRSDSAPSPTAAAAADTLDAPAPAAAAAAAKVSELETALTELAAARSDAAAMATKSHTLSKKLRDAEEAWSLVPGTLDAWSPATVAGGGGKATQAEDAFWLAAAALAAALLTLLATRSLAAKHRPSADIIAENRALSQQSSREKHKADELTKKLEDAEYQTDFAKATAADAVAAAEASALRAAAAAAAAARGLYEGREEDGAALGTVVDELRGRVQSLHVMNDALRQDNDGLRRRRLPLHSLDEEQEGEREGVASSSFAAAAAADDGEAHTAELLRLRAEVERLRAARLDATAAAAAAAFDSNHNSNHGSNHNTPPRAASPDPAEGEIAAVNAAAAGIEPGTSRASAARAPALSPSFKHGVAAAREAAEREAAALRAEAESLRDANARLLKEAAGLRAENHDLMQDLRQSDYGGGCTS
jgi:hypothetical protein